MYITQQLKNQKKQQINNIRLSFIMSEKRYSLDQETSNNIPSKICFDDKNNLSSRQITSKLKILGHDGQLLNKRNSSNQQTSEKFIRKTKRLKSNKFSIRLKKQKQNFFKSNKLANEYTQRNQFKKYVIPSKLQDNEANKRQQTKNNVTDLRFQSFKKLRTFIKGAYNSQLDQYSQFVNLSSIDQFRKDFYIFDNLYRQTSESNQNQKMTIRDVAGQNLKNIVFLNDQKENISIPELTQVMKLNKIIY